MAHPKVLKFFNVFHDGTSYLGEVEEVKTPTLKLKLEKYRSGGMFGSAPINMGLDDDLTLEHTYKGFVPAMWRYFGKSDVPIRFTGSAEDDQTGELLAIEIYMRGTHEEIGGTEAKGGDPDKTTIKTALTYYKLEVNGETLIEIDTINMVLIVDGEDLLAEHRKILGI